MSHITGTNWHKLNNKQSSSKWIIEKFISPKLISSIVIAKSDEDVWNYIIFLAVNWKVIWPSLKDRQMERIAETPHTL